MRTPRLYLPVPLAPGSRVLLPETLAHKLRKVLRLPPGSGVVLFNGDGHDHHGRLEWSGGQGWVLLEQCEDVRFREAPFDIVLLQGLARGEKMDWIVQKCTELGVGTIVPLDCERSELRLEGTRLERRLEHWRAVAIAACEQCGRAVLPEIRAPITPAAVSGLGLPDRRLLLSPDGAALPVTAHSADLRIALAVGPEGGFVPAEEALLVREGFLRWSLGPRILRTETAGMAAIAALLTGCGDFRGAP
jgi:16S rRNA (uracil1498-N3)-methyltransferase